MVRNAKSLVYNEIVLKEISKLLINAKATLSVAESVTSGCLQTAFSLAEGATLFFQGGITRLSRWTENSNIRSRAYSWTRE